jgi:ABC-type bacteriocin/lantibiotic exporter with double-glycine peptidase domain
LSKIKVNDCTFGWTLEGKQVLNNISLSIPNSKTTMIIGPVGCGKSTLLKGLLGETLFLDGSVRLSSTSVAFCDQTPWLINASIKENIVGFSDFDAVWYESVVHACVLRNDFDVLPLGDKTMVGSKGISLSGGQKQRVAIARAVYARKNIAIFDDIFSSLDAGTQQLLFSRVFGADGLLRTQETTVVLATHALSLLPHADHIISLGTDGMITAQGPFDDINQKVGYIYNFESKPEKELTNPAAPKAEQTLQDLAIDGSDQAAYGDFSVYVYYFRTIGWPAMLAFFLGDAAYAFLATFPSSYIQRSASNNLTNIFDQHFG